jgi:hypothetical protein
VLDYFSAAQRGLPLPKDPLPVSPDEFSADLRAQLAAMTSSLERDRTTVADGITAIKKELHGWDWLTEGRGSYEWDDDRYQQEFAHAINHISKAMEPLAKVAADWTHCPKDAASVEAARIDWKHRAETAEAQRAAQQRINLANVDELERTQEIAAAQQREIERLREWLIAMRDGHDGEQYHCMPIDYFGSHRAFIDFALEGAALVPRPTGPSGLDATESKG